MRLFVVISLAVALAVLGICIYKTNTEKNELAYIVKRLLWLGFGVLLVNEVALIAKTEEIYLVMDCIYFLLTDWLLYYMLQFSMEYVGSKFDDYVKRKLMILLLAADSVSLLLNYGFHHLFCLNPVEAYGGEIYYRLDVTPAFYIHYLIIMMLVTFCLISLFYGVFRAPRFYRSRYLVIAVIMVAIVIMNILTYQSPIDMSVFGYAVEAVCIYYCVYVFTPQRLLRKTLLLVAEDMSVGLLVLDVDGKKLYHNKSARKLLDEERLLKDKEGNTLEEWCRHLYMEHHMDCNREKTFEYQGEEVMLNVHLQIMMDVNKKLQGGYFVIQDRTQEINKLKKEKYFATHDSLTGLYNKAHFFEKAEQYIKEHKEEELLIVNTDIKDFKMINDLFDSKIGDMVLNRCAQIIREQTKGALVYGRIEGDVFGILMKKSDFDEKYFVGEMQKVFDGCMDEGRTYQLINYVGVYEIAERNLPVSVMLDRARMAISTIKGDYHDKIAYYDDRLRENIRYEQELISEMEGAIEQEQFRMYLQPQMTAEGRLLGAEALIRWQHPVKGMISPGEFIPVFEKNGLISDVDRYMWEMACRQLREWKDEGRDDLYISVNISPKDFFFLNVYQEFVNLIKKYEISPKNLKLEITETAVVMDFEHQKELISRLQKSGFIVEMDDFGSGYSSLNMLKDIYVDVLKIDMAFLKKAEDETRSEKILQMIIALSGQLDIPVITEGVETKEQLDMLKSMGCDMFQGYYFAKPMPVGEFENRYF